MIRRISLALALGAIAFPAAAAAQSRYLHTSRAVNVTSRLSLLTAQYVQYNDAGYSNMDYTPTTPADCTRLNRVSISCYSIVTGTTTDPSTGFQEDFECDTPVRVYLRTNGRLRLTPGKTSCFSTGYYNQGAADTAVGSSTTIEHAYHR